jgi:hypothetical protein
MNINRKHFISTILTSVSLSFCGLSGEKFTPNNDNILELKPLPNTKKFGIEVGYYNKHQDVIFMYFAPTKDIAKNWVRSLPFNTNIELKCEGYFIHPCYLTDGYWENKDKDVIDDIQIDEKIKVRIKNETSLMLQRFTLHLGFMDNAAYVYNNNDTDRKLFWNRIKSIYTPYLI